MIKKLLFILSYFGFIYLIGSLLQGEDRFIIIFPASLFVAVVGVYGASRF